MKQNGLYWKVGRRQLLEKSEMRGKGDDEEEKSKYKSVVMNPLPCILAFKTNRN